MGSVTKKIVQVIIDEVKAKKNGIGSKKWIDHVSYITRASEHIMERGYTLEEFKEVWRGINSSWDPDEPVVVYEFRIV